MIRGFSREIGGWLISVTSCACELGVPFGRSPPAVFVIADLSKDCRIFVCDGGQTEWWRLRSKVVARTALTLNR